MVLELIISLWGTGSFKNKMNILYITKSLGIGGANLTAITIAKEMSKGKHNVFILADEGPLKSVISNLNIKYFPICSNRRMPNLKMVRKINEILRVYKIDLICTMDFEITMNALPAAWKRKILLYPTYASLYLPPYPYPKLPISNVFSEELSNYLIIKYGFKKESFTYNIARIDAQLFNSKVSGAILKNTLNIGDDSFILVMVCRQDQSKIGGIRMLINFAKDLYRLVPTIKIIFFGDGKYRNEILEKISKINLELGKNILFAPGAILNISQAYAMADIVVANGARSALEGLACGKPVISIGENGFCGVLNEKSIESFRKFNYDKGRLLGNTIGKKEILLETIKKLYENESLRKKLSEFSEKYSEENLIIQKNISKYEITYNRLITLSKEFKKWSFLKHEWAKCLFLYYFYRAREKILKREGKWREELNYPVGGLDPEWENGLI